MDAWVSVIIPTITEVDSLLEMVRVLDPQVGHRGRIEVLDNGHLPPGRERVWQLDTEALFGLPVAVWDTRGMLLYQQWNFGLRVAQGLCGRRGVRGFAVVLNDDLVVPDHLIDSLLAPMLADPRIWVTHVDPRASSGSTPTGRVTRTVGSFRHGGMTGWAWAVRLAPLAAGRVPLIDSRLKIWGGDDDIALSVRRAGGHQVRVRGLGVDHGGEASCNAADLRAWVDRNKWQDVAVVQSKWRC